MLIGRWKERKGSSLLIAALVGSIVSAGVALGLQRVISTGFNGVSSSYKTIQAQHYADSKLSLVTAKGYSKLSAQAKAPIGSTGYSDEVVLGTEVKDGNVYTREVTVNVYLDSENVPRCALKKTISGEAEKDLDFGDPVSVSSTGTATKAGFLIAGGSKKDSMNVQINGTTLGYVTGRNYGTGCISVCVPIKRGASWNITGTLYWAYFIPLKG